MSVALECTIDYIGTTTYVCELEILGGRGLRAVKGEFEYLLSIQDKLGDYVDRWVAVVDDKIVVQGDSAKQVFKEAKEQFPDKVPFVMKIPSDAVMVM